MWVSELESKIFSELKYKVQLKLSDKYKNMYFTTTDQNTSEPKYPTIYFHVLPAVERGEDIEGNSVNAILYSIEIQVITNQSQSSAKEVMYTICDVMKEMYFRINVFPAFQNKNGVYIMNMRCSRVIGANDKL